MLQCIDVRLDFVQLAVCVLLISNQQTRRRWSQGVARKGQGSERGGLPWEAARGRRVSDGTVALGHDSRGVVDLQKASCNRMALAYGSSGAILARKALHDAPIRPCVSTMAGVTFAGLYLVRFLLLALAAALPTFPAASMQNWEVTCTSMSSSKSAAPCLERWTSMLAPFLG